MKRLLAILCILIWLLCGCAPMDYGKGTLDESVGKDLNAQSVDPTLHNTDTDYTLAAALRESFAGLDQLHCFRALPIFEEGGKPEISAVNHYIVEYQGTNLCGTAFDQAAEALFGTTYGLDAHVQVAEGYPVIHDGMDLLFVRLAAYRAEEMADGLTKVSVKLLYYGGVIAELVWDDPTHAEYRHLDNPGPLAEQIYEYQKEHELTYYAAARSLLASDRELEGQPKYIMNLTYLSEDGKTPRQYLSCAIGCLENGSYVYAQPKQEEDFSFSMDPEEWNQDITETAVDPEEQGGAEDSAITPEQRAYFQEFCRRYKVSVMREFSKGEKLSLEYDLIYYILSMRKNEIQYSDEPPFNFLYGETVEEVAALFGWSYDLDPREKVTWDAGELPAEHALCELVAYREEEQDGKTLVTVKLKGHNGYFHGETPETYDFNYVVGAEYSPNQLAIYDVMKKENCTYYEAACKLVEQGNFPEQAEEIYHLAYYKETEKTPLQFISYDRATLYNGEYVY